MTDNLTDQALDRLMQLIVAKPRADHIDKDDADAAWRKLADIAVYEEWDKEPDQDGDGGVIDGLKVREGLYVADITSRVRSEGDDLPYEVEQKCWVYRDHARPNLAEVEVRCELVAVLSPSVTDDRWLVIYEITEA